ACAFCGTASRKVSMRASCAACTRLASSRPRMGRVYVTGMGTVSSLGFGRQAYWEALIAGKSGASEVTLFDTASIGRSIACEVKGFRARDFLSAAEARRAGRCSAFAVAAARMAVEDANIP